MEDSKVVERSALLNQLAPWVMNPPRGLTLSEFSAEKIQVDQRAIFTLGHWFLLGFLIFSTWASGVLLVVTPSAVAAGRSKLYLALPVAFCSSSIFLAYWLARILLTKRRFLLTDDNLEVQVKFWGNVKVHQFPVGSILSVQQTDGPDSDGMLNGYGLRICGKETLVVIEDQKSAVSVWLGQLISAWGGAEFKPRR